MDDETLAEGVGMAFKFERLEIWEASLAYVDALYEASAAFPADERFILTSQLRRAATSISLNIAEGSTGQTDGEQARFLGYALRSVLETVACLQLARRRTYIDEHVHETCYAQAERLTRQLQAMRKSIAPDQPWIREQDVPYDVAAAEPALRQESPDATN